MAKRLAPVAASVKGTTRRKERASTLAQYGIDSLLFDGEKIGDELRHALSAATHIVVSIAPSGAEQLLLGALKQHHQAGTLSQSVWIGYLSTVGVYGDHQGRWIDEDSPCTPGSGRTAERLESEQHWQQTASDINASLAIFRLPGIYGPGRNALCNLAAGNARRIVKTGQVFNRAHVDDIAAAVSLAATQGCTGIYNISDDLPAAASDVTAFAAYLIGVDPPVPVPFEQADLSPMARSFYAQNKRVCNARSRAISGFDYRYPDYHSGLNALWQSGTWNLDA